MVCSTFLCYSVVTFWSSIWYIWLCICQFQTLNFSHLFLKVGGSAKGTRHSRFIVEAPCLPHAPSSLSPRTLQPAYKSQPGSRDVTPPRSLWPEGNRTSISFSIFFFFYPIIWTGVNYSLVGCCFFFLFQSTASWFSWWPEVCEAVSLWERTSFVIIARLHLEGISHDTCLSLSPLPHLEWSSLLYFLWLDFTLFPTSLSLRNIALCMCALSSASINL